MFPISVKIPEWHGSGGCVLVLTVAFALLTGSLGSYPDLESELAVEAAEVRRKETPLVTFSSSAALALLGGGGLCCWFPPHLFL